MIDDATVKRLVEKHTASVFIPHNSTRANSPADYRETIDVSAFAKACYAAGQDAQRESDAKICAGFDLSYATHTGYDCSKEILANKEPCKKTLRLGSVCKRGLI